MPRWLLVCQVRRLVARWKDSVMAGKPPTLERTLSDMQRWPSTWEIDEDRAAGETLVAALTPFVHHLYETGVATTTLRRHINNLWALGGEVIRRRHHDDKDIPPLAEIVDDEGGPLPYRMDEAGQRPFDATCRALHRFLTKPAGKRVITTRKPPDSNRHVPSARLLLNSRRRAADDAQPLGIGDDHRQYIDAGFAEGRSG